MSVTLGEYLRQEREHRGLSLDQVAAATKIGLRTLQALEQDEYRELPAKPFVRGFVQAYVRFLGLPVTEVLDRFDSFLDVKTQERPSRDQGHRGYAFEKKDQDRSKTILSVVLGGFLVVGGILILVLKPKLKHRRAEHTKEILQSPAPSAAAVSAESKTEAPATPPPAEHKGAVDPMKSAPQTPASTQTTSSVASVAPAIPAERAPPPSSPAALPVKSPVPSPLPSVVPSPSSLAQVSTSPEPSPSSTPDPLRKGDSYAATEIRYRYVIKAIEDVVITYKIDDLDSMKFALRKDLMIVLKAKKKLSLEVAQPELVLVKYRSKEFLPLSQGTIRLP